MNQAKQKLSCLECGFVAKNRAGLAGHRQFKHGVRVSPQLPFKQQDRFATMSELQQVADVLGQLTEQVLQAAITLKELSSTAKQQQLRLDEFAEELPGIKGDILALRGRTSKLTLGQKG